MVFLSRFPLCLAHTPSAADAAQRKNTARLTCQELSAAFYQLLCIPPLSPPATSDELPNNRTFQQWGFQLCSKPGPCRAFAEASSALGQDAAGATFSVALGTRLAALCLLEQPLSFFQNGIGFLFSCATAGYGIISRRGLGRKTPPKLCSSG